MNTVQGNPTDYYSGEIVNPKTFQFERSILDEKQAHAVCKKLLNDNRNRLAKDAAIMRKYNDEQPWDPKKLQAAGQSWRNNRATGFMSSLVRRGLHPYMSMIDTAKVLTSAKLNKEDVKSKAKSEEFQKEFTRMFRQWKGAQPFKSNLILENVLFGHASACWTDEWDWRPRFARNDDAIFPDGCSQNGDEMPLWMLRQSFQIHELATKIFNRQAASQAGWRIDNVVKTINKAKPENRNKGTVDNMREYQDTLRESTLGFSYQNGVKVCKVYHLFAKEASGKVTHWIVDADDGTLLFLRWDRFSSMEEILSLFSIEVGNGKFYGTKGAGRMLYNTHVAIEQARNLVADNLYLAGLLLLRATGTGKKAASITVTHPVCVIGEQYEAVDAKFQPNVDAFFSLDRHMSMIAEQMMGLFMPGQQLDAGGEKRTASEINYVASIEQQIREGVLARFWGQFMIMIWQMQKRMYSAANIKKAYEIFQRRRLSKVQLVAESIYNFVKSMGKSVLGMAPEQDIQAINPEAIRSCIHLLEVGLEPEDIFELAQTAPMEFTQDAALQNPVAVDEVVARYMKDPNIKQGDLRRLDIASKLGYELADSLVVDGGDESELAVATRQQLMEYMMILAGDPMPVAGTDNHIVHLQTMVAKTGELLKTLNPQSVTKESLDAIASVVTHFDQHLQAAQQAGAKDEIKPFQEFSQKAHALMDAVLPGLNGPQNQSALPAGAAPASANMNTEAGVDKADNLASQVNNNSNINTISSAPVMASVKKPLSNGPVNLANNNITPK